MSHKDNDVPDLEDVLEYAIRKGGPMRSDELRNFICDQSLGHFTFFGQRVRIPVEYLAMEMAGSNRFVMDDTARWHLVITDE